MNEKQTSVAAKIAELSTLPIAELWPVWDRYFNCRPINPNRAFIESRIAYKMQEDAFGGLAHNTRQRLEAIGAKHSKIKLRARPRDITFAPGTVLLREWGDLEHKVAVTADGLFEYEEMCIRDSARSNATPPSARHCAYCGWLHLAVRQFSPPLPTN